jgi:hypothetical protein
MADLIGFNDWSTTPLGVVEHWPQSLRTTVSLCLASNFPLASTGGNQDHGNALQISQRRSGAPLTLPAHLVGKLVKRARGALACQ